VRRPSTDTLDVARWPSVDVTALAEDARHRYQERATTADRAVRFANAAAISVTRLGAQRSAPTRREIETFLNRRLSS
jgi:sugar/nucleoside kinase (ribokinase family)